jgi:hypothetical protein
MKKSSVPATAGVSNRQGPADRAARHAAGTFDENSERGRWRKGASVVRMGVGKDVNFVVW